MNGFFDLFGKFVNWEQEEKKRFQMTTGDGNEEGLVGISNFYGFLGTLWILRDRWRSRELFLRQEKKKRGLVNPL